jgi:esterase/lipase superfamily enzyme
MVSFSISFGAADRRRTITVYLVTNRDIRSDSGPAAEVFSDRPNRLGPNELRVAEVERRSGKWRATLLEDLLAADEIASLKAEFDLPIDADDVHYVDLKLACDLTRRARAEGKNLLVFVHGYNNDIDDVLDRAADLEKHYGVIVLPFSWPANGGGIKGVADYKDDKNDAKASTVALDRFLNFISRNLELVTQSNLRAFWKEADERHPNDPEKRDQLYTKLVEKDCPFRLSILLHSMGNYLLKWMFKSTISRGTGLIFDNVVLCAADTNSLDHELWVDAIRFKNRVYITINEEDRALAASRLKSGQDQLARLGHVLWGLHSRRAHYVNFTDSPWVGNSHAYFEGTPRARNKAVNAFFKAAFNGEHADRLLRYRADINCYELRTR